MALLAQRHRDWGCLLVLPPQTSNVAKDSDVPARLHLQPCSNMRTSANSWQPEGASLESCCSSSSAHGTARTEAQRLALLACLATSNFKRSLGKGLPARLHLQPCSEDANVCRELAARRGYPGKLLPSLICSWHCSHRGSEAGAASLSSFSNFKHMFGVARRGPLAALL